MNRLHALSAGARAETGRWAGTVHSVFARACNLTLHDGRLLAVVSAEHGNAPNAVRVDAPPGFAFDRHVSPGDVAGCRGAVLRVGRAVEIRLDGISLWHAGLDGMAQHADRRAARTAWAVGRRCLARQRSMRPDAVSRVLRARLGDLCDAVARRDARVAQRAAAALAGVGPGLTPAGDDMLVGFLAGLHTAGAHAEAYASVREAVETAVRDAARQANAVSADFLRLAAGGEFGEALTGLALAIGRGDPRGPVEQAASRALAVGATSGADGVRGLLSALRAAWTARHCRSAVA